MSQRLGKFKDDTPTRHGKCEMCRDLDDLLVSCSLHGAMSWALCVDCIKLGLDPLRPDLVAWAEAAPGAFLRHRP